MIKVMFVCHGTICRSPMAEMILKDMVRRRGIADRFVIASSATSTEEIWGDNGNPVYPPAKDELRRRGYRLAIGSSSKNTPFILRQIGLGDYFDAVSDGNNITRSKPDPEVFEKAAQMLCIEPKRCLVVEDAVSGSEAAHRGGMKAACVGDASRAKAGDYNLKSVKDLLEIL